MIYLDHNATTPLAAEALAAMDPFLHGTFANASSVHRAGQAARAGVDEARERLACALGCRPKELVFTSGGTEADALAIRGVWEARRHERPRVVVSAVEHPAVLECARSLADRGAEVVEVGVDSDGALDLDALDRAVDARTALVSVMWANNETGIVNPILRIRKLCLAQGALLHSDAVQAFGKAPVALEHVDLLSVSAHKIRGPKGAGALWLRKGVPLFAQQVGGHQERGRRAGTENVAAVVGFGVAASLVNTLDAARIRVLRDRLEGVITRSVAGTLVVGSSVERLPNTSTICFEGVAGEALLMALDLAGICASSGSACSAGSLEPSHVLKAMRVDERYVAGAVRFSLGHETTEDDITFVAAKVPELVAALRRFGGR